MREPVARVKEYVGRVVTDEVRARMTEDLLRLVRESIPVSVPRMTVSEWAEEKRILPAGLTSLPGPFSFGHTPYLREIADCLSENSAVREVVVMKGARVGYSVGVLENFLGYSIDVAPAGTLFVSADQILTERAVQLRVDRMIESAGLQSKIFAQVEKRGQKATGDSRQVKEFAGGFLMAVGARSGGKLRSFGVKYLLFDEIDGYPQEVGDEGDPIALAVRRTSEFETTRKILYGSTPTHAETSRIQALFEEGDQRYFEVPCKHCGRFQRLVWEKSRLKYDRDDDGRLVEGSVRYVCEECGGEWTNDDKPYFLPRGRWVPTAKPKRPGLRSYHISSLYAPLGAQSWDGIAREWIDAQGNAGKLKSFKNTVLGEVWQDIGEAPPAEVLGVRRAGDSYDSGTLPDYARPFVLTAGVDVQKDRLEMELVAWGRDFESWSVGYFVIEGDTADLVSESSPWEILRALVNRRHVGLPIHRLLIDAGFQPQTTYEFASSFPQHVHAVSGDWRRTGERQMIKVSPVAGHSCSIVQSDSRALKAEFYFMLGRGRASDDAPFPPGYVHLPSDYSDRHLRQLVAEHLVAKRLKSGKTVQVWALRPGVKRNEQLDCRVYAMAGIYLMVEEVCTNAGMKEVDLEYFWNELDTLREKELYRTRARTLQWDETTVIPAPMWPEEELRRCSSE